MIDAGGPGAQGQALLHIWSPHPARARESEHSGSHGPRLSLTVRACPELLMRALYLLHSGGRGSDGISRLLMSGFSQLLPAEPEFTAAHRCPVQRTKSKPLGAGGFTRSAVTLSPRHSRCQSTEAGWVGTKQCLYF